MGVLGEKRLSASRHVHPRDNACRSNVKWTDLTPLTLQSWVSFGIRPRNGTEALADDAPLPEGVAVLDSDDDGDQHLNLKPYPAGTMSGLNRISVSKEYESSEVRLRMRMTLCTEARTAARKVSWG